MFSSRKTAAPLSGGYNLTKSLRFRSSASAYLNRTFSTPTNNKIFTYSAWVKLGNISSGYPALLCCPSTTDELIFNFTGQSGTIQYYNNGSIDSNVQSNALYRDPAAWYHVVCSVDTTQTTASNRVKLYVNGLQITSLKNSSYPSQNYSQGFNSATPQQIGKATGANYFDGYMTEVNFIDGQALTPSSFGSTNALTGVWQPAKYTGTYGTNGFYLPFTNITSTSTLGNDSSGNGNNWTTNNFSLTTGSNYDSMYDVPTLTSATVANYCVLNPVNQSTNATLSEANLSSQGTSANYAFSQATFGLNSGKWYFEVQKNSATQFVDGVCLVTSTFGKNTTVTSTTGNYSISDDNTNQVRTITNGGTPVLVSTTNWANSDIIQCAYDADTGKIWFGRNGSWYPATNGGTVGDPALGTNPTITGVSGLVPAMLNYNTSSILKVNFGQRAYSYTPPTGFVAINTYNL